MNVNEAYVAGPERDVDSPTTIYRGRCFCDSPISVVDTPLEYRWVLNHGETPILCLSQQLVSNLDASTVPVGVPIGIAVLRNSLRDHHGE